MGCLWYAITAELLTATELPGLTALHFNPGALITEKRRPRTQQLHMIKQEHRQQTEEAGHEATRRQQEA